MVPHDAGRTKRRQAHPALWWRQLAAGQPPLL